jgi:DNA-binding transcriptional MerR regulator
MPAALTIREVAAATGTSVHTLRYYERIGLMCDVPRTRSGHRRYGPDEMKWVEFLTRMHQAGMSIQRMLVYARLYRAGDATIPERRRLLADHRRALASRIERLGESLALVDAKLRAYQRWEQRAGAVRKVRALRRRSDSPELRLHAAARAGLASVGPRERRVRVK